MVYIMSEEAFWSLSPQAAIAQQREWAKQIDLVDHIEQPVTLIAGVDVGFERDEAQPLGTVTRAAIVVVSYPALEVVESIIERVPTRMPYIPGLLSFRELPAVIQAYRQLSVDPQLLMVDGHGIAHPRFLGIAAHLGLHLNKPAIGIAKKKLFGHYEAPGENRGDYTLLCNGDKVLGNVLRTRVGVKPVFVSPGYHVSVATARDWVIRCLTGYKLPEPTRQADRLASRRLKHLR